MQQNRSRVLSALVAMVCLRDPAGLGPAARGEDRKAAKADYTADLAAFFAEVDRTYPFFDLKDIRRGWGPFKAKLAAKAKTCKSDGEFIGIVHETIRYLRDAHMGIVNARAEPPAAEPEYYPGVAFLPAVGNRVVVMAADGNLAKDLQPGMLVAKIDGKDARALLEAKAKEAWDRGGHFSSPHRAHLMEYRIPLRGKKGEKHSLAVTDGKKARTLKVTCDLEARGWPHVYNMPAGLTARGRSCSYGKLPSGVGYIYLRFIDGDVEPGIAAALEAHKDAKGWILDIRGNGGGGYDQVLQGRIAGIPKPVACIIDAGCMSAGETFARDIVAATGARLFGSPTAGASSAKRIWTFPSGIATLSLPTRSRMGIGKIIEFFGIHPDEEVEAVPEEVAKGLNSEILRAEEYLLRGGKPAPGGKGAKKK